MIRIVPAIAEQRIKNCGPYSCRFYGTRADNGMPICWHKPRTFEFNEPMIDGFPAWCPLEEAKPTEHQGDTPL